MPCLSRQQSEQIADGVMRRYKQAAVPEKHLCYRVDPTELASLLGFTVDYQYLTTDGSVLGATTSEQMKVLSRKYSQFKYECFCDMAEFLQVSRSALAYRMEQLGLLERNLLVEEAISRKGAV